MGFDALTAERPTWRGRIHAWAFVATIPAGTLLIAFADRPVSRAAASIYVASMLLVFGTSAAYHRLAHSLRARQIMRRADHSMIYLLIMGTYAPICLVALPPRWGIPLFASVGVCGAIGMVIKLGGIKRFDRLGYALYLVMGWAAVIATPALRSSLTTSQLVLMLGGGLAYTVGFPVLVLRRPDPWPTAFGYHEIWHGLTVVAAALHFSAVAVIVA